MPFIQLSILGFHISFHATYITISVAPVKGEENNVRWIRNYESQSDE